MPVEFSNTTEIQKLGTNVRTMKSDVSEFLASTKPSLIKILSNQIEEERAGRGVKPSLGAHYAGKIGAALVVLVSIGVLAAGGYVAFRLFKKAPEQTANVLIPQPFFRTELSETIELGELRDGNPAERLSQSARIEETGDLMKRLIILTENDDGKSMRVVSAEEFFEAVDVRGTPAFAKTLSGPVMPLSHKSAAGMRFAMLLLTNDANRARAELLRNEHNLAFNWSAIFLDQKPEIKILPYEDRIYRNISYRIAPFDPVNDLQLAYGVFSAKDYLIFASSEETFRAVINRLYEAS